MNFLRKGDHILYCGHSAAKGYHAVFGTTDADTGETNEEGWVLRKAGYVLWKARAILACRQCYEDCDGNMMKTPANFIGIWQGDHIETPASN